MNGPSVFFWLPAVGQRCTAYAPLFDTGAQQIQTFDSSGDERKNDNCCALQTMMIRRYARQLFFGQTIQGLFRVLRLWLVRLCRLYSSNGPSSSSFMALFSFLFQLANVLCLDGLGTFDLFRGIPHSTKEQLESEVGKKCTVVNERKG